MISKYLSTNTKWYEVLKEEFSKEYFLKLMNFIDDEYSKYNVYPEKKNIFKALNTTDFDDVKIVILGQDPYHKKGQANGLAFSVSKGITVPPSLKNIFKELNSYNSTIVSTKSGDLTPWAKDGVLLLNTILTVRENEAYSHSSTGWEIFTDEIIKKISIREKPIVFMLWGNPSRKKKKLILQNKASQHLILEASHPSPLSSYRGFLGSNHFRIANSFLKKHGIQEVNWSL